MQSKSGKISPECESSEERPPDSMEGEVGEGERESLSKEEKDPARDRIEGYPRSDLIASSRLL